jgi:hypothetical protein
MPHKCNKEVELTKIQQDIGYIKKAIAGNGEQGLLKETRKNTEFRLRAVAQLNLIKWLIGIVAGTTIVSIANLAHNLFIR